MFFRRVVGGFLSFVKRWRASSRWTGVGAGTGPVFKEIAYGLANHEADGQHMDAFTVLSTL